MTRRCPGDPELVRKIDRALEHVDAFFATLDPVHLYAALDIIEESSHDRPRHARQFLPLAREGLPQNDYFISLLPS